MNYQIDTRNFLIPQDFFNKPNQNNFYSILNHMGFIKVIGEHAEQFLQGQLTNDIREVFETTLQKSLLCNLKGQIVAKLLVAKQGGDYLIFLPKDNINEVLQLLSKTAQLSRVTLESNTELPIYGIYKPNQKIEHCYPIDDNRFISFSLPTLTELPEIYWHYQQLINNDFDIYPSTCRQFLPHHLQLENDWIHFNKGCYRGQEIIARMHYLGKSKYELKQMIITNQDYQPGTTLYNDQNQTIGEIVDICPISNSELMILGCIKK
jgi:hypothetical protein